MLPFQFVFCGLVLLSATAFAEEVPPSRLAEIQAEVDKDTTALEAIKIKLTEVKGETAKLREELKGLKTRERNLDLEFKDVARRVKDLEQQHVQKMLEYKELLRLSGRRLRAIYMNGEKPLIAAFFRLSNGPDSQRQAYYLTKVKENDTQMLDKLNTAAQLLVKQKADLASMLSNRDALQKDLQQQKVKIQSQVALVSAREKELESNSKELETTVTALRAQALRLETVVSSLTDGSTVTKVKAAKLPAKAEGSEKVTGYSGKGLASGTRYPLPMQGQVVLGFGQKKAGNFKDMVTLKGVEFQSKEKAVKAIADGQVMYTGRMPGLGTILIVDHGARTYSLYGRLAAMTVRKGEVIKQAQTIAYVDASTNQKDGNFYFEIRKSGKAVDPMPFLRAP